MGRDIYTPPKGSIAETVVDYFRRNPTEVLAADDMFEKFGFNRAANMRMALVDAYTTDLLSRREVSGELIYKAGKRLLAEIKKAAPAAPSKPARKASASKTTTVPATAKPAGPTDFPDPLTVPIEDDVPCTSHRAAAPICWMPLLARLTKPMQSAALPIRCRATLGKSITQAHKSGTAKYRTSQDKVAGIVRVWRVA